MFLLVIFCLEKFESNGIYNTMICWLSSFFFFPNIVVYSFSFLFLQEVFLTKEDKVIHKLYPLFHIWHDRSVLFLFLFLYFLCFENFFTSVWIFVVWFFLIFFLHARISFSFFIMLALRDMLIFFSPMLFFFFFQSS